MRQLRDFVNGPVFNGPVSSNPLDNYAHVLIGLGLVLVVSSLMTAKGGRTR